MIKKKRVKVVIVISGDVKNRIKSKRVESGYTQKDVADRLGVAEATVNRWESGEIKTIKQKYIVKMAEMFQCDPAYLSGWNSPNGTRPTSFSFPILGRIPAGIPVDAVEDMEGIVDVPTSLVDRFGGQNLFALLIQGESMNKVVANGSIGIFYKTGSVENNTLVAVSINGDDVTLKRYIRADSFIILKPESFLDKFEIKTYEQGDNGDFRIVGKLIASIKMFV